MAPIPGRGAVGVEVPNPTPEMVAFRELLESREFTAARIARWRPAVPEETADTCPAPRRAAKADSAACRGVR